jgi:two-component system, NarL family, response regulator NreC
MSHISILISDDHTLVRHGIKTILEGTETYKVIGEASDAEETVNLVRSLHPDILLLDLGLPSKSGLEILYQLREEKIPVQTVVLTMHENELMVRQAIMAGASAYMLKSFTPQELLATLEKARQGQRVVPPRFQYILDELVAQAAQKGVKRPTDTDPLHKLSKREREVFYLLADGMPNRTIAKKLFISPRTVETHRARVIKKLGFKSTADLIRYAIKNNLLTP